MAPRPRVIDSLRGAADDDDGSGSDSDGFDLPLPLHAAKSRPVAPRPVLLLVARGRTVAGWTRAAAARVPLRLVWQGLLATVLCATVLVLLVFLLGELALLPTQHPEARAAQAELVALPWWVRGVSYLMPNQRQEWETLKVKEAVLLLLGGVLLIWSVCIFGFASTAYDLVDKIVKLVTFLLAGAFAFMLFFVALELLVE